jgi:hypothetical protein
VAWNSSGELVTSKKQAHLDIHIPRPFVDEGYDSWDSDVSDDEIPHWARKKAGGTIPSRMLIKEEDTDSSDIDFGKRKITPRSMEKAIANRALKNIEYLLQKSFDAVATGEFEWLKELKELGYPNSKIAGLLLDSDRDSPWIFFKRNENPELEIDPHYHHPECMHSMLGMTAYYRKTLASDEGISSTLQPSSRGLHEDLLLFIVDEACGLDRICPDSRNSVDWLGQVEFTGSNTELHASITYNIGPKSGIRTLPGEATGPAMFDDTAYVYISKVITKMVATMVRLSSVISQCQRRGMCCDYFTILWKPSIANCTFLELRNIAFLTSASYLGSSNDYALRSNPKLGYK